MTPREGIVAGSILTTLCTIAFAVGISLLVVARGMPAHTDEARATKLMLLYLDNYLAPEKREPFANEIVSLRTPKWKLYSAGLALCLTAPVLLIAVIRFRLWDLRRLASVTTPQTRLRLLVLAGSTWLALFPAFMLQLDDEYTQDDLTPTVDTGHGISLIFLPPFFAVTCIILILVGRFIVLRNALLPAELWCWDSTRPYRNLIWTFISGLLGAALVVVVVWSIPHFPWSLPSLLVGLYVIVSARAAVLNGRQGATADANG